MPLDRGWDISVVTFYKACHMSFLRMSNFFRLTLRRAVQAFFYFVEAKIALFLYLSSTTALCAYFTFNGSDLQEPTVCISLAAIMTVHRFVMSNPTDPLPSGRKCFRKFRYILRSELLWKLVNRDRS